jgi:chromate transporter
MIALSALTFVGIFFLAVPFPLVILGAALIGLVGGWAKLPALALHLAGGLL